MSSNSSKTRTKSSPVALPGSKEELLQLMDKLPYAARIEYAAKMGRHHRESPQFLELVKQLLDIPKPDIPDKVPIVYQAACFRNSFSLTFLVTSLKTTNLIYCLNNGYLSSELMFETEV